MFELFVELSLVLHYLYMQFLDKQQEDVEDDLDYRALESGYVSVSIRSSWTGCLNSMKVILDFIF